MTSSSDKALIDAATSVRENAYGRYSGFRVGAAIRDTRGNVYIGCNVENASYPQGNCAETGAIAAMIADGGTLIETIAVVGGFDELISCTPCGGCRQRINEFANADTRVLAIADDGNWHCYSMDELLPASFHLE